MRTVVAGTDSPEKLFKAVSEAGDIIRAGGLVAFPTETVYGLGADGFNEKACAGIYEAKGRPSDNPLILHIGDFSMLGEITEEIPLSAEKVMTAFCPGPVTLILKKSPKVPDSVTGGLGTVGIRMPAHDVARAMIKAAGCPVAAPSANISGRPSPTTAEAVLKDLDGRIPLIIDGGPCGFGVESTILDCTESPPVILRPGAITKEMLEEVLGKVLLDTALVEENAAPKAPGMKYRHYAPKAPLWVVECPPHKVTGIFRREIKKFLREGKRIGVIACNHTIDEISPMIPREDTVSYGSQGNLREIASRLYESLRAFDEKPMDGLLAEGTSEEGIGLAIMNRLRKAAGGNVISD